MSKAEALCTAPRLVFSGLPNPPSVLKVFSVTIQVRVPAPDCLFLPGWILIRPSGDIYIQMAALNTDDTYVFSLDGIFYETV